MKDEKKSGKFKRFCDATNSKCRHLRFEYRYVTTHFSSLIHSVSRVLDVAGFFISIACLTILTVYVGFEHEARNLALMNKCLRWIQAVYIFTILFNLTMNFRHTVRNTRFLKWVTEIGLLITLLPALYPHPEHPWIPVLEQILYSRKFLFACLGAYAMVDLCYGFSKLAGRRTNPSLLMAGSFLFFILVGSFVLTMPKCTYHGISYMDSLFVSTSAVCICGLTPVEIATTFTPLGQTVLCVMFEIGGLGVITFTSFFAIYFSGTQTIYNQLLMRDMIYSKSMNDLLPTLLYILVFTLLIQTAGAFAVYFTLPDTMGMSMNERIGTAVFHSMSGFCNVGFSNIEGGMANPALMESNQSIYIVMSVLVFAGAIGFPILMNFKDIVVQYGKRLWRKLSHDKRKLLPVHIYDLNTKIVLATTLSIFFISFAAFFLLERTHSLKGMPVYEQMVQSLFNAVMPRSGGFSTISPGAFLNVTLLLVVIQMWIGGASQSMAGGVKVNTLGVIFLNLRAIVTQTKGISAFERRIAVPSVRRANAVIILSLTLTALFSMALMLIDPQLPMRWTLFEVVSSTFNVGSSMGATPYLSDASKGVLCVSMFLGRVGIISLLSGMLTVKRDASLSFPSENVIIN